MSYPTALETLRGLLVTLSGLPNDRVLLWGTAQVTRRPPKPGEPDGQITLTVLDDDGTDYPYRVSDEIRQPRAIDVQVDALGVDGCSGLRRAHALLWSDAGTAIKLTALSTLRDTSALETTAYAPRLTCTLSCGYPEAITVAPPILATAIPLDVHGRGGLTADLEPAVVVVIDP